ncbi:MAG TPA: cobalamin biosynthesis protein CobW [Sutterella sp.]|nr:cobalamin biosynthesis protein CobW [Sutterella sp.]
MELVPVTILTGFLGAGKTTLLNRILREEHGRKIAVIENEFGEEDVDSTLLVQTDKERIVSMSNGCICCTIRGDLSKALTDLKHRRDRGELDFERVIIETTGVANPGPVAQTFFMDDAVASFYRLDAVITLVDAKNGNDALDKEAEAQAQVGFADRIYVTKSDLVTEDEFDALKARLRAMNPRAPIQKAHMGEVDVRDVLDIGGFNISDVLDIDPDFLTETGHHHHHGDEIGSFIYESDIPFDPFKLERFWGMIAATYGPDLLRYKGVLYMKGTDRKMILQGVHMLCGADLAGPWGDEKPASKMVFIGRNLPKEAIITGLDMCLFDEKEV